MQLVSQALSQALADPAELDLGRVEAVRDRLERLVRTPMARGTEPEEDDAAGSC